MLKVEFLLMFILAHLAGDYVFQTNKLASLKASKIKGVVLHSLIVTVVQSAALSFFGAYGTIAGLAGGAAHFLIDLLKLYLNRYFRRAEFAYFIFDQLLHLAVMAAITQMTAVKSGIPFPYIWLKHTIALLMMSFFMTVAARTLVRDIFPSEKNAAFFGKHERLYDAAAAIILWLCWKSPFPWSLLANVLLLFPYIYLHRRLLNYRHDMILLKYGLYSLAGICLVLL